LEFPSGRFKSLVDRFNSLFAKVHLPVWSTREFARCLVKKQQLGSSGLVRERREIAGLAV
jgi:hypothetical protein